MYMYTNLMGLNLVIKKYLLQKDDNLGAEMKIYQTMLYLNMEGKQDMVVDLYIMYLMKNKKLKIK